MGFEPLNHRFGALVFSILFLSGILGILLTPDDSREYKMAFIGSLVWVFAKFSAAKNIEDRRGKAFDYMRYMDAEWDNLGINLSGVFIVVPQMTNIVNLQKTVEYSDLWYYAAGILTDALYIIVILAAKAKKKYESGDAPKIDILNDDNSPATPKNERTPQS